MTEEVEQIVDEVEDVEQTVDEQLEGLEKWLMDVVGKPDVESAKRQVELAVQAANALPGVGILGLLVGPDGLMNVTVSQNLLTPEGMDNVGMALLDAQRETMRTRKQMLAAPKFGEPDPEPEPKPKRKVRRTKKAETEKEQTPAEGS